MKIVIVGSVALDDVKTPAGSVKAALGGSAVYSSLAASFCSKVGMVGVVGDDFSKRHVQLLQARGVDTRGLEHCPGNTFHWSGYYEKDMGSAHTLETHLNVFGQFKPQIPAVYQQAPFLFLANIDPVLQLNVLQRMKRPRFILLDTMNYWIETKRKDLLAVLGRVHMVVVNDAEARQLSGCNNLILAARWIQQHGPAGVIIKKGEHGSLLFWHRKMAVIPAYPVTALQDPTGAGDTFAGGLIGALAQQGKVNLASLHSAAALGTLLASFTVEGFSVKGLLASNKRTLTSRYAKMKEMVTMAPFSLKISV